jgi:phosphatidylglycerol---prolipoprotein diacylglyceryl transferase
MLPYLHLGPLLLQTTGLALLLGIWIGLTFSEKEARRLEIQPDLIYNLVFYALLGGLVGARLIYVLRYLNAYLANPASLFSLNLNSLDPAGGLLIGILTAFVYGRWKGLALRPTLDALAPGLAVFMVALGVSHLLSGNAFGSPVNLPWSIYLWDEYRHPSQVYEILAALGVLLIIARRPLGQSGGGLNFLLVIALSAAARLFLEAFRGDSLIWPGGLRAAQVLSLLVLLAALWWLKAWTNPDNPAGYSAQDEIANDRMK